MELLTPNTPPRWSQWAVLDGGMYQASGATVARLPAGAYTCTQDPYGNALFLAKPLHVDDLIDFAGSLPSQVLHEIEHFWQIGERFHRRGFLHRRGYLFHGKQGCGKSSLIHQVIAKVAAAGHLAFFCEDPNLLVRALEQLRVVEPQRPMVCIFEDIDAIIAQFGDSALLQWLDGNHQVDRAINLATTNHPEVLDPRIVSRPRRFDRVLQIGEPDERVRELYFARKLPELEPEELSRWVQASTGLSFAALAELVISVDCLGHDLDETAELLRNLDEQPAVPEFAPALPAVPEALNGVVTH
jgi:hypothetical protein